MSDLSASGQKQARAASMVEVALLALAFFALPLFEAPKNVASLLFLIVYAVQSLRLRHLGQASPFEWPIIGLIVVLWIGPTLSEFRDVLPPQESAVRWSLLGLFVLAAGRLNYSSRDMKVLMAALLLGGAWAVIDSFYAWSLNDRPYPEFRSVGHVNHSGMYSLIPLAVGIATFMGRAWWLKLIGACAVATTLAYLPPSRSLVSGIAIVAIIAVAAMMAGYAARRLRYLIVAGLAVLALGVGIMTLPVAQEFRAEAVSRVTGDDLWSGRDKILNSALEVYDRHPLFGTGFQSFGLATAEEIVRAEVEGDGRNYDAIKDRYWFFGHGHNLWTTMLIERGILGVVLITWLLVAYFRAFLPLAIRQGAASSDQMAAQAGVLIATGFLVAGLGNTTMMNEHGQAGMGMIAILWGYLRSSDAPLPKP
ncbi:O-antigen ligase family protein [Rhodobacterales bacterium HKCCA1288]|nr:O-antigen ligase family protein [Rhodobacterales bacterium HKCCA1288]